MCKAEMKKKKQAKLDLMKNHERVPMQRPAVFKDKTKYDRKRAKREVFS